MPAKKTASPDPAPTSITLTLVVEYSGCDQYDAVEYAKDAVRQASTYGDVVKATVEGLPPTLELDHY